jgi:hypothetical protein
MHAEVAMPVFEAVDEDNPPIRMPEWDEDEYVVLRPHVTYAMERRAQGKALQLPPGMTSEQLRALPEAEVEALLVAHTDNARIDEQLLLDMIERWTLRRYPTKAQREKGERGDIMPLCAQTISQLPPAVGQFIRAEIEKRRDVVAPADLVGPKGDDFRASDDVPDQGLLPGAGEPTGLPDAHRGRDRREDGLDARPNRRLPRGAAPETAPLLERQGPA